MSDLLPAPNDLGAPEQFTEWRDFQDQAVTDGICSDARFVVQSMPTGSGKSLVCVAQALASGTRVAYLTSTKGLQDQMVNDFSSIGAVSVKGRKNYDCCMGFKHFPMQKGSMGERVLNPKCKFAVAIQEAQNSQLVILNYTMWMHHNLYNDEEKLGLGDFDMLILDESHASPDELASFLNIEITNQELGRTMQMSLPELNTLGEWKDWARANVDYVAESAKALAKEAESIDDLKLLDMLYDLTHKMDKVIGLDPQLWVCERFKTVNVNFDIIEPSLYAEDFLFTCKPSILSNRKPVPRILLVSATVTPKTCQLLGVPEDEMDFMEYPHTFPLHNKLTLYVPTVKLSYRSPHSDLRFWVNRMDQIIRQRLDRKGIIHVTSYKNRDLILEMSKYSGQMISHGRGDRDDAIETFKGSPDPCILLSPSVSTGFDFPYEQCEFQIIGKVPWPSSQTEVMKARQLVDNEHIHYIAMQSLIQAAGRGVRAPDDHCETFIIDDQFAWFPWKYKHLAPKWFLDSIKKTSSLPKPPESLLAGAGVVA